MRTEEFSGLQNGQAKALARVYQRFYMNGALSLEVAGAHVRRFMYAGGKPVFQRTDTNSPGGLLVADRSHTILQKLSAGLKRQTACTPYGYRIGDVSELGFVGERLECSIYYALGQGTRFYSTSLMRFTSADRLSPFDRGGINAYAYCGNDPINRVDMNGHFYVSSTVNAGMMNWLQRSRISALYRQAPAAKLYIDTLGATLARRHGGHLITAGLKERSRATQKINTMFGGDPSKINDISRNTLIVEAGKTEAVISELRRYENISLVIISPENTPVGYSGVHAKVRTPAGPTAEMQIHTPEMIYANLPPALAREALGDERYRALDQYARMHGYTGGQGHHYFEVFRNPALAASIRETARLEGRAYYSMMTNGYVRL